MRRTAQPTKTLQFPKGFLWGATTAAYQVEGDNIHSDWWEWEKTQELSSGKAADHYRRYKTDFALAKKLGHNAHRLSLEWARIEVQPGIYSKQAIRHYKEVLRTLKSQGMKTFVTLHHFTNPAWFSALGGFAHRRNVFYFERYVQRCAKEFAGLVDFWITFNEPLTYISKAYIMGIWPPQQHSIWRSIGVLRHMAYAHNRAYGLLHAHAPTSQVGMSQLVISYYPKTPTLLDRTLTKLLHYVTNDVFLLWTKQSHDYIGINYYFHNPASLQVLGWRHQTNQDMLEILKGKGEELGWVLTPQGIYPLLTHLWRHFGKPIYITEHGLAGDDTTRQQQLRDVLYWIHRSVQEGVDIRGYLHWSLLDNFEWQLGFAARMGLIGVDFKSQRRRIKPSGRLYAEIARKNKLTTTQPTPVPI